MIAGFVASAHVSITTAVILICAACVVRFTRRRCATIERQIPLVADDRDGSTEPTVPMCPAIKVRAASTSHVRRESNTVSDVADSETDLETSCTFLGSAIFLAGESVATVARFANCCTLRLATSASRRSAVITRAFVRLTLLARVQSVLRHGTIGAHEIARPRARRSNGSGTDGTALNDSIAAAGGSTEALADLELALIRLVIAGTVDQVISRGAAIDLAV